MYGFERLDKAQIVMASRLGESFYKMTSLPGMQWLVPTKNVHKAGYAGKVSEHTVICTEQFTPEITYTGHMNMRTG